MHYEPNDTLMQKINELIRKDGRSIPKIAEAMQISRAQLYRYTIGERGVPPHQLKKLADVLHIQSNDYFELFRIAGYPVIDIGPAGPTKDQFTPDDSAIRAILERYTSGDLDFVGCVRRGRLVYVTHDDIVERITRVTTETAKKQIDDYVSVCLKIAEIIDSLDLHFKHLDQGRLVRTIFDVQQGGLFFYYLRDGAYIFAATIDQTAMDGGDKEVQAVVRDIKRYMRLA